MVTSYTIRYGVWMKLVLDTDAIVAAVQSERGASRELLLRIVVGELAAGVSVPLLLDYEAVLKRPAQLAASGLSTADIDVFLDEIAAVMEHVRLFFLWRLALRDAGDDMVLETAVNGGADCIVTFNDADFGAAPSRFGIAVIRPGPLLGSLP